MVADLIHKNNLIYPQIKQVGLFIYIKSVLFSPLRPQYIPNMLGCPHILVFGLFSVRFGPIWPYASLLGLFMPNYHEDRLVMKGIHQRMNPLYLYKAVLTYCWSTTMMNFSIFACFLANLGQFDLMLARYVYLCLTTMSTGW